MTGCEIAGSALARSIVSVATSPLKGGWKVIVSAAPVAFDSCNAALRVQATPIPASESQVPSIDTSPPSPVLSTGKSVASAGAAPIASAASASAGTHHVSPCSRHPEPKRGASEGKCEFRTASISSSA